MPALLVTHGHRLTRLGLALTLLFARLAMAELSFPFPAHPPARMVKSLADRAFDPAVHLQIEPPTEVYLFPDFVKVRVRCSARAARLLPLLVARSQACPILAPIALVS